MPRSDVSRETNIRSVNTAWLYAAVSSDKQAETLAHQREWAERTCRERGWVLTRATDPDESVVSGKAGPRKPILRLLADLEQMPPAQRPGWLLMLRLDRVGRGSIVESQVVVHKLKALGVRVWTRDQGEIKNDSAMDELMIAIASTVARMENDVKREKSTNAHARIKRDGKHYGHAPYGTVLVDRRPVAYEPEAVIVREIFARRLRGWGVHRLAKWAARIAPPKRKTDGSFRVMKWATGTIEGILACTNYRGVVVPDASFDAVQAMRTPARRRPAVHPWPLRGAVRCTCGYLLTGSRGGSGAYRQRYYLCKNVAAHDAYPLHRASVLEAQFAERLKLWRAHPDRLARYTEPAADAQPFHIRLQALQKQRAALERRKSTAWDLAEAGNISPAQLRERLAAIDAQITENSGSIAQTQAEIDAIGEATFAAESANEAIALIAEEWPRADVEDQQEMAAAVAASVGGFWVAPGEKGSASRSVLQTGFEMHTATRFDYSRNCTQLRNYANRSTAVSGVGQRD